MYIRYFMFKFAFKNWNIWYLKLNISPQSHVLKIREERAFRKCKFMVQEPEPVPPTAETLKAPM